MDHQSTNPLTFEQALQEAESIVKNLETGNTDLELAMKQYTRAKELLAYCNTRLNNAQLEIQQIIEKEGKAIDVVSANHLRREENDSKN